MYLSPTGGSAVRLVHVRQSVRTAPRRDTVRRGDMRATGAEKRAAPDTQGEGCVFVVRPGPLLRTHHARAEGPQRLLDVVESCLGHVEPVVSEGERGLFLLLRTQ